MAESLRDVKFDFIRYGNCWEDAGLLLHALRGRSDDRIAIVSSAGDNALALLSANPKEVLAFDISMPQLYLSELKQVAFSRFEHAEILQLVGVDGPAELRVRLFNHLSPHLSTPAKNYWQQQIALIKNGLIHSGKFERYFGMFRRYCLPLVHSQKNIQALLQHKSGSEQKLFYNKHWNTLRWRMLMSLFFSKAVMGRAGRDPYFLKQVAFSVSDYIRQKAESHLQSELATQNAFLEYIFTGRFKNQLPHYLRPENFETIRSNIGRLTLRQASADEVVAIQAHDVYCLSNIFEYFPKDQFDATVVRWTELLKSGSLLLFWNLMVPRSFSWNAPDHFFGVEIAEKPEDCGFFYSNFQMEQKR
jgi:S-adenosylmethionine-diacylglycerol 3-amino-3-carboxypropyl transferase